jgi:hypothetical protein
VKSTWECLTCHKKGRARTKEAAFSHGAIHGILRHFRTWRTVHIEVATPLAKVEKDESGAWQLRKFRK